MIKTDKILVSTTQLCEDISRMETCLEEIKKEIHLLYLEIRELDSMCDGKGMKIHKRSWNEEYVSAKEVLCELDKFIQKMKYANRSYYECKEKISEIVDAINI